MIFYELVQLYQQLVRQGKIGAPGWVNEKVSYGIMLDENGTIVQLISKKKDNGKGDKMLVPQHPGRTSGTLAFFLWDNEKYLLGLDAEGKPEKARERFRHLKNGTCICWKNWTQRPHWQ